MVRDAELHYLEHLARLGASDLHPAGRRGTALLEYMLELGPGQRVLEIGCGTGHTLVRLAASHRIALHGVDRLDAMLGAARRRLRVAGVGDRVALLRANGAAGLPFADLGYDRVYAESVLGFQSAADARALLREIHRVLRPGGRFVLNEAVWRAGTSAERVSQIHRTSVEDFGLAQASETGWTQVEWLREMQDAGFHVRDSQPLGDPESWKVFVARPLGDALPYYRAVVASELLTLLRSGQGFLGPKLRARRREYRRRLARHRDDGRHIEGWLFVLEKDDSGGGT